MKSSRLIVIGTAAVLLPFAAAFAQSPPDQTTAPAQQSQGATFESLDANSDGKISKDEAKANPNVTANFSKYDANGDGFIERAEVTKANQSQTPKQ